MKFQSQPRFMVTAIHTAWVVFTFTFPVIASDPHLEPVANHQSQHNGEEDDISSASSPEAIGQQRDAAAPSLFSRVFGDNSMLGIAFIAIVALLFIGVPFLLELVLWLFKRPGRRARNAYQTFLDDWTHRFLVALAVILVVSIVFVTMRDFVLSPRTGQASTDMAGTMLSFFGLVLTAVTIVTGVFAWNFKREVQRVAEGMKAVDSVKEASLSNLILTADLALMNLPKVTWTQQIPVELVASLGALDKLFVHPVLGEELATRLRTSGNGARIRYARGLYLLARGDVSLGKEAGGDHGEQSAELDQRTVLWLLSTASRLAQAGAGITLPRDIRVRRFQALRQMNEPDYNKAFECIDDIRGLPDGEHRVIKAWARIVGNLQRGFACEVEADRAKYFEIASNVAVDFYRNRKDLFTTASAGRPEGAALFYYCAKACWAWRCTQASPLTGESKDLAKQSVERAMTLLDKRLTDGVEDYYITAIYAASWAYLGITCKHFAEFAPSGGIPLDVDLYRRLSEAEQALDIGGKLGMAELDMDHSPKIYNDHFERLGSEQEFREYLQRLREYIPTPAGGDALVKDYKTGFRK